MAKKLHLGFKETQAKIAKKQGISMKAAGAVLADSARKASPAAVKKNPSLLNVKRSAGKKYKGGGKVKEMSTGITEIKDKKNYLEDRNIKKTYAAKKDGKLVSRTVTRFPRKGDMHTKLNTTSMDTTGYAAGNKKTFTVKQTKSSLYGKPSGNSWEIARGRVEGTIKDMKNGTNPKKLKQVGKITTKNKK
jgi:hypothetical protein